jgi:hypothetical protein
MSERYRKMDGSQKTAVGITMVIVIGIVAITLALVDYHNKKNDQISNAKTCEAAVVIDGGMVEQKLLLCAIGSKAKTGTAAQ